MAEPVSDAVAESVAADIESLKREGRVPFTGYVMRATKPGNDGPVDDPQAPTFRLYTSPTFDRWLEIAKNDLVHQEGLADARSRIWVKANAVITQSQYATAVYTAQLMDTGGDDPTAYPRGSR